MATPATVYPGSIDSDASIVTTRKAGDAIPAADHNELAKATIAIESKLGAGASQPTVAGQQLISTGPNATSWQTPQTTNVTANSVVRTITQSNHGFSVGNIISFIGTSYTLARADTPANAEVVGIVSTVMSANAFTVTTEGYVTGLSGLTVGSVHFLSSTQYGTLVDAEPSTIGVVSKPVFVADTTTSGYFHNYRGSVINTTTSSGSGGTATGSGLLSVRTVTSSSSMTDSDDVLYVTAPNITITLQSSQTAITKAFRINNSSNGQITITAKSGNTVDGISTFKLLNDSTIELVPYQTNWIVT